ncbi:Tetratricopeptide repeat protein 4, partial [Rhizoclosmatium hyalinum]
MALNWKEQGNEAFQAGKTQYKSAIEHYSKGIAAKCSDAELNSVLYCNRAAVNLELCTSISMSCTSNFRKVLNDCAEAIKLNPKNVKAFYRSTKALLALERIVEARDSCKMGLQVSLRIFYVSYHLPPFKLDPENKALLDIQNKIEARNLVLEKAKAASQERERLKKEKEELLWKTIKARGVTTVSALKKEKPSAEDISRLTQEAFLASHSPALDPATNTLTYPVVFLYPEHTLSDFIAAFHEQDTFADHIAEMFGPENRPPWDTQGVYVPEHIEVYFETRPDLDASARGEYYKDWRDGKKKLMRVDPASTLQDVVGSEAFRLVDG